MKIKLTNAEKNRYPNFNVLFKKNLEFIILISATTIVVILVQLFNYIKEQKRIHFFEITNNIYF